jgi:para-aminobenzoate synthetase component I
VEPESHLRMESPRRKLSRSDTILAMNDFGRRSVPFAFLVSFSGEQNLVVPLTEAEGCGLRVKMPGISSAPSDGDHSFSIPAKPFRMRKQPVDPGLYREAFEKVLAEIRYGNTFLLNLTFPTRIRFNFELEDIFRLGTAPFMLYLRDEAVVFSPERFIRIRGRIISSNPMKGTIDAGIPGAYRMLMEDKKEAAEHNTIVDLIRNDLSLAASDVTVKRFRYIEEVRTNHGALLQMSSEITGRLPGGFQSNIGDLLFGMLPAGSVSGAPKQKTVEIIRRVETYSRGYYTGVFGIFDGEHLDSAVAIRFIEKTPEGHIYKSGGGITFRSRWENEYREMIGKIYVPL